MQVALNTMPRSDMYSFLHSPKERSMVDLSCSNMINVLREHENYKRKLSPDFTHSSVINRIDRIQRKYECNVMPWRIDEQFYVLFYDECRQEGLTPSTIENYCVQMRAALNWGMHYGCPVSNTYENIQCPEYQKTKVALTPDEISQIYHFNLFMYNRSLPNGKHLRKDYLTTLTKVKDMFVLSCLLGQRYSDMCRIVPDWFNENRTKMKVHQKKTSSIAVVDIDKFSQHPSVCHEILKKYNYNAPYPYDINNYNKYLHKLLKLIGDKFLTRIIRTENKIDGDICVEERPLWKAISSHTGRRTFITLACMRGIPLEDVMYASGHKDYKTASRYRIRAEEDF